MTKGQSAFLPPHASITVHAPAKVNLILRILDRRSDGYHNLWSIMHTVALEDDLTIRVTSSGRGIKLTCGTEGLPDDHTNLVWKAASAVLDHAGLSVGIEVELRKRIPMGAGLGGGSSDVQVRAAGSLLLSHVRHGRRAVLVSVTSSFVMSPAPKRSSPCISMVKVPTSPPSSRSRANTASR